MSDKKTNLIWTDLEMTGLDTAKDEIIEIATIVTDQQLNLVAEGPVLAIHQPDEIMDAMDEWNTRQHGKSGLTRRVRESQLATQDAERMTLEFLAEWDVEDDVWFDAAVDESEERRRAVGDADRPTTERDDHEAY